MRAELIPAAWARRLSVRHRARLRTVAATVVPALMVGIVLVALGVRGPIAVLVAAVAGGAATALYARRRRSTTPAPAPPRRTAPVPARPARPVPPTPPTPASPAALPTRLLPAGPDLAVERSRSLLITTGPEAAHGPLKDAVADPAVDPALALAVVDELVDAQSRRAEQSRDDRGYADAIALLTDLIRRHPQVPGGKTLLHSHRAQYLMFQAGRLAARGEAPDDLFAATETELRAAIAAAEPLSPLWAQESAALGMLLGHGPAGRRDEGLILIRQAMDSRVPLPAQQRAQLSRDLAALEAGG